MSRNSASRNATTAISATGPSPLVLALGLAAILIAIAIPQTMQEGALPLLITSLLVDGGTSSGTTGVIVALPWVMVAIAAPFADAAYRRLGGMWCLVAGALLSILCCFAFPYFSGLVAWAVISLAVGIAFTFRWIAGETWLMAQTPAHLRGRVLGIQETLIALSGTVGALIPVATGMKGAMPFIMLGLLTIPGIIAALIAARLLPRVIEPAPRRHEQRARSSTEGIRFALFAAFAGGLVLHGTFVFLPTIVPAELVAGRSPLLVASLFGLGSALLQVPYGLLIDRLGPERLRTLLGTSNLVAGLLLFFLLNTALGLPVVFVAGITIGCFYTWATLSISRTVAPAALSGAIARLAVAQTLGSVLGPPLTGYAIETMGAPGIGLVVTVVGLLVTVVALGYRRPEQVGPAD